MRVGVKDRKTVSEIIREGVFQTSQITEFTQVFVKYINS